MSPLFKSYKPPQKKNKIKLEINPNNIELLRITALPTEDFPGSGLTSYMISKNTRDKIAIWFPKELCLHAAENLEIISDLKFNLATKSRWIKLIASIYYSYTLARLAKQKNINVVHIHWVPLIFITLFMGSKAKYVLTIHGQDARYLSYFPFRYISTRLDKIYVVGRLWTDFLLNKGFSVSEIENFSPIEDSIKEKIIYKKGNKRVLNTVRLCLVGSEKDHKNINIFKRMPEEFFAYLDKKKITLTIVGISEAFFRKVTHKDHIPAGINILGRQNRLATLNEISKSNFLLLPSFTEGNPKVVWEAVQVNTIPIISDTITFLNFDHNNFPFRFNPVDPVDFWEKIKLAIITSEDINLEDYFKLTSYESIREEYNQAYFN